MISVVIPVYNEEGNLNILYSELKQTLDSVDDDYEIVFVNDGSTDDSHKILNDISKVEVRVKIINFEKNSGLTSALDAGFHYAQGDFIITLDADLQYKTADLLKILQELKDNDVVISYRVNRLQADGFIKMFSSKIANYIRNKILNENFHDVGSLKAFKKPCLEKLVLYRGFNCFIPSLMRMSGFRIKEIPIESYRRKWGHSKYNLKNRLLKEFLALLVVKWMQKNRLSYKIKN